MYCCFYCPPLYANKKWILTGDNSMFAGIKDKNRNNLKSFVEEFNKNFKASDKSTD